MSNDKGDSAWDSWIKKLEEDNAKKKEVEYSEMLDAVDRLSEK